MQNTQNYQSTYKIDAKGTRRVSKVAMADIIKGTDEEKKATREALQRMANRNGRSFTDEARNYMQQQVDRIYTNTRQLEGGITDQYGQPL